MYAWVRIAVEMEPVLELLMVVMSVCAMRTTMESTVKIWALIPAIRNMCSIASDMARVPPVQETLTAPVMKATHQFLVVIA